MLKAVSSHCSATEIGKHLLLEGGKYFKYVNQCQKLPQSLVNPSTLHAVLQRQPTLYSVGDPKMGYRSHSQTADYQGQHTQMQFV